MTQPADMVDATVDLIDRLALALKLAELDADPRLPTNWPGAAAFHEALLDLAAIAADYPQDDGSFH